MFDEFNIFKDHSNKNVCNAWVAAAIVGSSVIGAGAKIFGATSAANAQRDAAQKASDTAIGMYDTTRADLAPYRAIGQQASTDLSSKLDFLTSPIVMDQAALEQTPGYKFTLDQGNKAVQNSAAVRGLGVSGALVKGITNFTEGTANQTYKDQFALENTNRTNAYNRLKGLIDTGEGAAAATGSAGTAAAKTSADAAIGAGNATAAADNSIGASVAKGASDIGGYYAYRGLYGGNNNANA